MYSFAEMVTHASFEGRNEGVDADEVAYFDVPTSTDDVAMVAIVHEADGTYTVQWILTVDDNDSWEAVGNFNSQLVARAAGMAALHDQLGRL